MTVKSEWLTSAIDARTGCCGVIFKVGKEYRFLFHYTGSRQRVSVFKTYDAAFDAYCDWMGFKQERAA